MIEPICITDKKFAEQQATFHKANPTLWLMIRPDRPFDAEQHRYQDDAARARGDAAMKAWFEYLAGKRFFKTFNTWRAILKSGKSLMLVCDDPGVFDQAFIPPQGRLFQDFWHEFETSRLPLEPRYDHEMRKRIAAGLQELAHSLRMNAAKLPPKPTTRPLREWAPTPLSASQVAAMPNRRAP